MFDKTQMMKGILEGSILKIIDDRSTYGYKILEYLKVNGFDDITEGTIYSILLRLEKQNYIIAELQSSPLGPKRKYYSLTDDGRKYLKLFRDCWLELSEAVNHILIGYQ